jgi:hypothetical protein
MPMFKIAESGRFDLSSLNLRFVWDLGFGIWDWDLGLGFLTAGSSETYYLIHFH